MSFEQHRLSLTVKQIDKLDNDLAMLGEKIPARFLLLLDDTGQPITQWGNTRGVDVVSMGALAAADLAATMEMSMMLGEPEPFQLVLREGQEETCLLLQTGPRLVLLALVSRDVPLGWARLLSRRTSRKIADRQEDEAEEAAEEMTGPETITEDDEVMLSPDIDLEELFSAELDDLWS